MSTADSPRFKFVVGSAEEAVTVLRDQLGPGARVLSVRQIEGKGLARFLRSPKLEVIAEAAKPSPQPEADAPGDALTQSDFVQFASRPIPRHDLDQAAPLNQNTHASAAQPNPPHSRSQSSLVVSESISPETGTDAVSSEPATFNQRSFAPTPASLSRAGNRSDSPEPSTLARLLRAGGLSASSLTRLQAHPDWDAWQTLPPNAALTHVAIALREIWQARTPSALGQRIAFLGTPGVGKTTALCKQLAADTFVRRRRAAVLKLDLELANPGDGLAVFCEALGIPFARDISEIPTLGPDDTLYLDVPGVVPSDTTQTSQLLEALGPIFTTARVLVLNAAYEVDLLKRAWEWGEGLQCNHTVFTHLDELQHWGKLWEFILPPAPTPVFLGTGQSIAGDMEENVFDAVLARTFPASPPETKDP